MSVLRKYSLLTLSTGQLVEHVKKFLRIVPIDFIQCSPVFLEIIRFGSPAMCWKGSHHSDILFVNKQEKLVSWNIPHSDGKN